MKKILMFWCCVFALNVNVAFASGRCNPMVNYSGGTPIQSSMFDDYLNIQGRSGTLVCVGSKSFKDSDRDNVCDANQVVFANYAWIGRKQGTNDADSKYRKYVCSKDSQDGGEWFVYDIDKCKD